MAGKIFLKPWVLPIFSKFQNYPHVHMVFLKYIKRLKVVVKIFWTSYVRSIYVLCPGG